MADRNFEPGDWVIYRKTKFSAHPGPRAENVAPAQHGDQYAYTVDKFWIVTGVNSDGSLELRTRSGKQHQVSKNDLRLRKANWWERWRYRDRFEFTVHPSDSSRSDAQESHDATFQRSV